MTIAVSLENPFKWGEENQKTKSETKQYIPGRTPQNCSSVSFNFEAAPIFIFGDRKTPFLFCSWFGRWSSYGEKMNPANPGLVSWLINCWWIPPYIVMSHATKMKSPAIQQPGGSAKCVLVMSHPSPWTDLFTSFPLAIPSPAAWFLRWKKHMGTTLWGHLFCTCSWLSWWIFMNLPSFVASGRTPKNALRTKFIQVYLLPAVWFLSGWAFLVSPTLCQQQQPVYSSTSRRMSLPHGPWASNQDQNFLLQRLGSAAGISRNFSRIQWCSTDAERCTCI